MTSCGRVVTIIAATTPPAAVVRVRPAANVATATTPRERKLTAASTSSARPPVTAASVPIPIISGCGVGEVGTLFTCGRPPASVSRPHTSVHAGS